jgi:hypothetical protein
MPRGRVGGNTTPETLAKVFRGHFRQLDSGEFAAEVEIVVDGCPQFLFDLMKLDYFPSEKLIRTAMSLAFPELASDAACMSKQLKCVLNYMNKKRKTRTDGSRMHQMTSNILDWLEKAQQESLEDSLPMGHDPLENLR